MEKFSQEILWKESALTRETKIDERNKEGEEGKMELEFATGETYYPMASDHSNI